MRNHLDKDYFQWTNRCLTAARQIMLWNTLVVYCFAGFSQSEESKAFTLKDCIAIAIENNIDLNKSELQAKTSMVNYKQSRSELLPVLKADYSLGINDGRSIDPFTNDIINQKLTFSNAGLSLDATIFNGFKIMNSIKESRLNLLAAETEIEETKQNLILDVTLLYIQILNNRDLLKLANSQLITTEGQLNRLKVQYDQGNGNPVDYTDIRGQYAIEQAAVITAKNTLKSSIIDLLMLLNLDIDSEISFENIAGLIGAEKYPFSSIEIYNDALENLATFKSKQLRVDASESGIKVARSDYLPVVSFFGRLNTNYSSLAQIFTETGSALVETGDFVTINSQDFQVQRNEIQRTESAISYTDQFDNNLSSVLGISVSIPIFNGFLARNNVALKKIEKEENIADLENTKVLFKQAIEQAYDNMVSAYDRYHILLDQVSSFEESFRINEIRFDNGVSNIVEYITSKNNMNMARISLNTTKYEYILRVKILDYYRGLSNFQ